MARYVVIEVYPQELINDIVNELIKKFNEIAGLNSIKGSIKVISISNSRVVIRVSTRLLKYLRTAVLFTRKVRGIDVGVAIIRVSGTLRKAIAQEKSIPRIFH